jgi:restriction system protein
MPRRSSLAEDLILCPWWVSAGLGAVSWVALRAIFPTVLSANASLRALALAAAQFAPLVALFFLALALVSAVRAALNRRRLDQQTGLASIRSLSWKRFEDLIAEAYRRQGYRVEETLSGGADGGVDLVLGQGDDVVLVQCKRWKNKAVPVQTVRELCGVLHERRASAAKLVATTRFTSEAIAFARGKPIELVDQESLLELINGVQASRRITSAVFTGRVSAPPTCPTCGLDMVMRTARRGRNVGNTFWGCRRYPRCCGTRSTRSACSGVTGARWGGEGCAGWHETRGRVAGCLPRRRNRCLFRFPGARASRWLSNGRSWSTIES